MLFIIKTEKSYRKGYLKGYCKSEKIIEAIRKNPKITQEELAEIVGIARKNIIAKKNFKRMG